MWYIYGFIGFIIGYATAWFCGNRKLQEYQYDINILRDKVRRREILLKAISRAHNN